MKRIVWLALAFVFIASSCFALSGDTHAQAVQSYRIDNTTGDRMTTAIPITSIRPNIDKIVGYQVYLAGGTSTEMWVSLFDGTDKQLTGECLAESEINDYGNQEYFPYPKQIISGLVVSQGAQTVVQIYFVSN